VREPLRIYCHGTPQFTGKYAWLNERDFDWWGRRAPVAQTAGAGARSVWWGEEGQHQSSPPPADPTQWLRVEAAVVIATLRQIQTFGMLGVQVDYALMWVDVAGKPEVLDLGRVLAGEGAGEASCGWSRATEASGESICLLTIALRRPVRTMFAIPFSFPDMQRILAGMLRVNALVLRLDAPPEGVAATAPLVDAHALYQLASTPSREMIRLEFDWAARHDLQGKLLRWAREGIWEA
jgi:hypothetical protein